MIDCHCIASLCISLNKFDFSLNYARAVPRKSCFSKKFQKGPMYSQLSNDELRKQLIAKGVNVGPITPSTRSFYEKQLVTAFSGGDMSGARSSKSALERVSKKVLFHKSSDETY